MCVSQGVCDIERFSAAGVLHARNGYCTIEGCTFPNWKGEVQKRVMTVSGDEMKLTNPTAAIGGLWFVIPANRHDPRGHNEQWKSSETPHRHSRAGGNPDSFKFLDPH